MYLETVRSIGGILGGFPSVELCIAAEEKPLQFTADGRAVAATVIFHRRQHPPTLDISGPIRQSETHIDRVLSEQQQIQIGKFETFACEGHITFPISDGGLGSACNRKKYDDRRDA